MNVLLYVALVVLLALVFLALFTGVVAIGLVLVPSPGRHSAPTPVRDRVFPPRESMQLDADEAWDGIRHSLDCAGDDWPAVVPLHARRQPVQDHELSRAA